MPLTSQMWILVHKKTNIFFRIIATNKRPSFEVKMDEKVMFPRGGGGGTAIYGLYRYVPL